MSHGSSILCFTASACILLISLVISLPVYFAGYERFVLINESLQPCTATVTNVRNVYKLCAVESCSGSGNSRHCWTDYVPCWDHYATFRYTPSGQYVLINSTQSYEDFLWNDYWPTQDTYTLGMVVAAWYNMCPYTPLRHTDQEICHQHGDMTPFYLYPKDAPAAWRAAVSFFVFACLSALCCLVILCYWLLLWCSHQRFVCPTITCPTITCPTITCPKFVLPQAFVRREVVVEPVPFPVYVNQPAPIGEPSRVNPTIDGKPGYGVDYSSNYRTGYGSGYGVDSKSDYYSYQVEPITAGSSSAVPPDYNSADNIARYTNGSGSGNNAEASSSRSPMASSSALPSYYQSTSTYANSSNIV